MLSTILQVAAGGALGASGRYLIGRAAHQLFGPGFPWGTVIVNVAGSFAMGCLVVWLAKKGGMAWAPFLMTGMLGGFTTFSAFSLDVATLYERGAVGLAAAYILGTVVTSVAGLFLGLAVMRSVLT